MCRANETFWSIFLSVLYTERSEIAPSSNFLSLKSNSKNKIISPAPRHRWGRENTSRHRHWQHSLPNEACEARLVTCTASAYQSDLLKLFLVVSFHNSMVFEVQNVVQRAESELRRFKIYFAHFVFEFHHTTESLSVCLECNRSIERDKKRVWPSQAPRQNRSNVSRFKFGW